MNHSMRRKDRQLEEREAIRILTDNKFGVLSTIGSDGYPYGVPVNYIYDNGSIYFHCATEGQKLENLQFSEKVSFTVIGKTQLLPETFSMIYESVIIFGKAKELNGDDKINALSRIVDLLSPDFKEKGASYIHEAHSKTTIIRIEIEEMTGKARK